jgi:hypothetical protein
VRARRLAEPGTRARQVERAAPSFASSGDERVGLGRREPPVNSEERRSFPSRDRFREECGVQALGVTGFTESRAAFLARGEVCLGRSWTLIGK